MYVTWTVGTLNPKINVSCNNESRDHSLTESARKEEKPWFFKIGTAALAPPIAHFRNDMTFKAVLSGP